VGGWVFSTDSVNYPSLLVAHSRSGQCLGLASTSLSGVQERIIQFVKNFYIITVFCGLSRVFGKSFVTNRLLHLSQLGGGCCGGAAAEGSIAPPVG